MIHSSADSTHNDHFVLDTIGRVAAIVLGLFLVFLGLGLGVTVIMLPAGVVIGCLGLLLIVGGLSLPGFRSGA